ncbi:SH3 domain-containing protein [Fictibacillus sp. Mic-4]|uniref:SH3 domain-containing protein n=1 Tax=Fictibacillus sp. Mic-4 TaxID=3132826 RepID=UPI003CF7BA86
MPVKRSFLVTALKIFTLAVLTFATIQLSGLKVKASTTKTAVVDATSLNVRKGPGTSYKKIGSLKDKTKVTVYLITKNNWAKIKYSQSTAFVSNEFLRYYQTMSRSNAKKIVSKPVKLLRTLPDRSTRKKIHLYFGSSFTSSYIDKIIKYDMEPNGKDKYGNTLYSYIGTDAPYYYFFDFDWNADYSPKKPTVTYFVKNNTEYLYIKQYITSELAEYTQHLYLYKTKDNWKVYKCTY